MKSLDVCYFSTPDHKLRHNTGAYDTKQNKENNCVLIYESMH